MFNIKTIMRFTFSPFSYDNINICPVSRDHFNTIGSYYMKDLSVDGNGTLKLTHIGGDWLMGFDSENHFVNLYHFKRWICSSWLAGNFLFDAYGYEVWFRTFCTNESFMVQRHICVATDMIWVGVFLILCFPNKVIVPMLLVNLD